MKLNRSAVLFISRVAGSGRGSLDTFTARLELLLPLTKIPLLTKEPFNRESKNIPEKLGKISDEVREAATQNCMTFIKLMAR